VIDLCIGSNRLGFKQVLAEFFPLLIIFKELISRRSDYLIYLFVVWSVGVSQESAGILLLNFVLNTNTGWGRFIVFLMVRTSLSYMKNFYVAHIFFQKIYLIIS
jgi:hypothetical protein